MSYYRLKCVYAWMFGGLAAMAFGQTPGDRSDVRK